MRKANTESSEDQPQNIHYDIQAAAGISRIRNFTAEWPQAQQCQFQGLQAERYSNDGNH